MVRKSQRFELIFLLFLCLSPLLFVLVTFLQTPALPSVFPPPNIHTKAGSNHLVNASANSSTISYAGLSSYGDIRNFYYAEGGYNAYVNFISNVGSKFEGYLVYEFPETYYDIENFTIWIKERRKWGSSSLDVFVLNSSSGSYVDIGFNLGTQNFYVNHSFIVENGTYPDIDDFFDAEKNQVILKIRSDKYQHARWMIDWTDIELFGSIDSTPPTILSFTRNESAPYDNQTILFNVTAVDDLSGVGNVTLKYESSALFPNITFYRDITSTKVNDSYIDQQQLFNGTWNVTAIVTDNEGNTATQLMTFTVLSTSVSSIFLFSQSQQIQRTQTAVLDIYIIAGVRRHRDLWIYDAFLDSNVSIATNINNFSSLHYQYTSSLSISFGEFEFIAYLDDQIGKLFSSMPQNISVLKDSTPPDIFLTNITDLRVGINNSIQIDFTVNTTNNDFNISDIIIENVFSATTIYTQKDLNVTEFSDTIIVNSLAIGDFPFKFFANDTDGNYRSTFLELHWEVLLIPPTINVYADRISQFIFQPITLFITVMKTEYNLSHVWFYDPFLSAVSTLASGLDQLNQVDIDHIIVGTAQGTFIITIMIEDIYGNLASADIPLTFYIVDPIFPEITSPQGILFLFAVVLIIALSVYATSRFISGKAYDKRMGVKKSKYRIRDKKKGASYEL